MNANVSKLLNEQINKEFYSAYLYLDFANYYAAVGLDGFENWYRVQAQEERDHAMLFYQYLQNNGEGVTFAAIAKPEWERGNHMTPLKKALEHEKLVTASIDAIYAAAYEAKDFRAMQMLDWFIKEQGEEEKNAADLITEDGAVRRRQQGAVYAQQRAEGTGLHRALPGAVSRARLRAFASDKRQTAYRRPAFSSGRRLEETNYI